MATVGTYLAQRLQELGVNDYFAIPGDYNLGLLDELLKNDSLHMINCCNELNAGYAADGYARIKGVSALVVTYSVGGLSAVNAVAGAYAENLPIIVISGGLIQTRYKMRKFYTIHWQRKITAMSLKYLRKLQHIAYLSTGPAMRPCKLTLP